MSIVVENSINTAHNHAALAEEHANNGLIMLAMEEHFKAAEAYMTALEDNHDESAKRTLRLLYSEQLKVGKEMQRRIDKLVEEGKDPSLPQKFQSTNASVKSPVATLQRPPVSPEMTIRADDNQHFQRLMSETAEESFMLLGTQKSEAGDPFSNFWNLMQTMMENLSEPVAFASLPLGEQKPEDEGSPSASGSKMPIPKVKKKIQRESSTGSDAGVDEPIFARLTRRIGMGRDFGRRNSQPPPEVDDEEFDDSLFDDLEDDLSGSFLVVPTGTELSPTALKKENTTLKAEITTLQKRLEATEKVVQMRRDQDHHLRESLFQATKEAQRVIMGNSLLPRPNMDLSNLHLNPIPVPNLTPNRENQYLRRIKELEEEVRLARIENEKNKAMISRYREKWEKLKESAKRKKDAKAAAKAAAHPVRERIVEEPEEEEALDNIA